MKTHWLALLVVLLVVGAILVGAGFYLMRQSAAPSSPDSMVLHFVASRTGNPDSSRLEVWLDLSTGEGRRVQMRDDSTATHIDVLAGDTDTAYVAQNGFAVVRHGITPGTPAAGRLCDSIFMYRTAVERGVAKSVGMGTVAGRATERIELSIEGQTVVADIDAETGLPLREEWRSVDGQSQVIETTYRVVEYLPRSQVPAIFFSIALPSGVRREEHTEIPPGSESPTSLRLPYAVYGVSHLGPPVAQFRSAGSGGPAAIDTYYIVYRTNGRELQVLSGLPPDLSHNVGKTPPVSRTAAMVIAGGQWTLELSNLPHGPVRAEAYLEDAYVTIHAPDRAAAEQAAANLIRISPRQ